MIIIKQLYYLILSIFNILLKLVFFPFLRCLLLNIIGQKVSLSAAIHEIKIKSLKPNTIFIGKRSIINNYVLLDNRDKIYIGKDVCIAEYTKIYTNYHDHNLPKRPIKKKKVVIKDKAFLYSSVIVNPGVVISEGSVIGSGSILSRSTKPYFFYAGNPATIKGKIDVINFKNGFFGYGSTP